MNPAHASATAPWIRTPLRPAPVPRLLVELPVPRAALRLAAVAVTPLAVTAALASLRQADPATSLREQGGE